MPKIVDHDERRRQIVEALIRQAGREGLHAVTMRSVAAEAGVSLRLVQYYFISKGELMHAALRHLERQSRERWAARLAGQEHGRSVRDYLEAFAAEALPGDGQSRTFHLLWTSFALLSLTDPDLARQPFVAGPQRLEGEIADRLRQGQIRGELAPQLDATYEAARLLTLCHGLGTGILVGQRSPEAAMAIARRHLDHLFDTR